MRLSDATDLALLEAISRGEFTLSGFRNHDIRRQLYPNSDKASKEERQRLSARVSRLLRLLRAHGVILKIQKTHRYRVTSGGRPLTTALFATRAASVQQLLAKAA